MNAEREIVMHELTDEYFDDGAPDDAAQRSPRPAPLDWSALHSRTPPPRDWAIDHWLGMGHVTLLAGEGGTGKTLLAQTKGSCLALGRDYIDAVPRARRVLMWAAEDDHDELWRRQVAIAAWLRVPLSDFAERLYLHSYDGEQVDLAAQLNTGQLVATPMLTELREQIGDYRAEVVMLDNIARLYAGNENDRHQVTSFIAMLTAAARPTNAAVLLLGHPGKAAGAEYSGSTAWEGSVRSRLYLGRTLPDIEPDADGAPSDDTIRYLARRKANYSARDWRKLVYADGVLVPEHVEPAATRSNPARARTVVGAALRKLAAMNEHGNTSTRSDHYLPRLAAQYRLLDGVPAKEFAAAMRDMQTDGTLVIAEVGRYRNRSPKMGLAFGSDNPQ
jgi:hypothetical protein